MSENPLIEKLRQMKPALEKYGVKRLRLFGSVARGDDRPDSDVDLLIDFQDGVTFFEIMDVQESLEKQTGRKIDIVTPGGLHEALKEKILREARDV